MKVKFISLALVTLFSLGCASNQANSTANTSQSDAKATPSTNTSLPMPSPAREELNKPGKPAANGKTIASLYNHLKAKGWNFTEPQATTVRMYTAEESAGFRDEKRIGYMIMRFENAEKARANFEKIDTIYRSPRMRGRALLAENFILAVFGTQKGINQPILLQLEESDYKNLQADLDEYFKKS
ncbi:MAG: hypothetical protein AB1489_16655 [Acidobacteriota bacterium]